MYEHYGVLKRKCKFHVEGSYIQERVDAFNEKRAKDQAKEGLLVVEIGHAGIVIYNDKNVHDSVHLKHYASVDQWGNPRLGMYTIDPDEYDTFMRWTAKVPDLRKERCENNRREAGLIDEEA